MESKNPQSESKLTPERITQIRGALGQMESRCPTFTRRKPQDVMIARVAEMLQREDRSILVVEAPTGVGKTIGYLLPSLLDAQANGKKLIISTATIALQQQVLADLASLTDAVPMERPLQAEVVKGRGRYVCDRNAFALANCDPDQASLAFGGEDMESQANWPFVPTTSERNTVLEIARRRQERDWSGDMDSWDGKLTPRVRAALATTHGGCAGSACPHAKHCPVLTARTQALKAEVLVTNHALLMADGVRGAGVLPSLEDAILVIDEAHRLAEFGVSASALSVSLTDPGKRLKALSVITNASTRLLGARAPASVQEIPAATTAFGLAVKQLATHLSPALASTGKPGRTYGRPETRRLPASVTDPLHSVFMGACGAARALSNALDSVRRKLTDEPGREASLRVGELGGLIEWVDAWSRLAGRFASPPDADDAPFAVWLERSGSGEISLHSSGVEAAGVLRDVLWRSCTKVVLTSATLTDFGAFDHFAHTTGLHGDASVRFVRLRSPFDPGVVGLSVPPMAASPSDTERFAHEVITDLSSRIDPTEGTLILFASNALLAAVHAGLPEHLRALSLRQGDVPVDALLREHRSRIDAGGGSILLGVAGLAEGVDLPGAYNTHTIVVKLPFPTPDDPVLATHAEWLESRGGNAFLSLYLPDTFRRLVQSCGRLIRRQTDRGRLTLLDGRLLSKPYGRRMLEHLPAYRRIDEPRKQAA